MTNKKFRRLSKSELIDIIYELQKREREHLAMLEEVKAKLDDREIRLAQAGSIAEAALSLNDVFAQAQAAADQYLAQIQHIHTQAQAEAEELVAQARQKAEKILADARAE